MQRRTAARRNRARASTRAQAQGAFSGQKKQFAYEIVKLCIKYKGTAQNGQGPDRVSGGAACDMLKLAKTEFAAMEAQLAPSRSLARRMMRSFRLGRLCGRRARHVRARRAAD
eukprot:1057224-Pleurochrysis_carterae.AAC.1